MRTLQLVEYIDIFLSVHVHAQHVWHRIGPITVARMHVYTSHHVAHAHAIFAHACAHARLGKHLYHTHYMKYSC